MKSKLIPLLIANLFAAAGVLAADGDEDMKVSGSVTVGVQGASLGTGSESNPAKLKEYRDIEGGGISGRALSGVDIKGLQRRVLQPVRRKPRKGRPVHRSQGRPLQ
jgi:hypothetical protein